MQRHQKHASKELKCEKNSLMHVRFQAKLFSFRKQFFLGRKSTLTWTYSYYTYTFMQVL